MASRPSAHPADYYDLAADVEGIHRDLRATIRDAWIRGAVTAALFLAGCGLGLYALILA